MKKREQPHKKVPSTEQADSTSSATVGELLEHVVSDAIDSVETAGNKMIDGAIDCSTKAFTQVKKVSKKAFGRIYYRFHEIPSHMQDNEFIHSGYRAYYSVVECMKSLFHIHNETVNIWTHLVGTLFYFGILFITLGTLPNNAGYQDIIIICIFLFSAMQCLFCSSLFHTFCAHNSIRYFQKAQILDYCGITSLICGSFLTYLHYGLLGVTFWRVFYYVVLGLLGLIGSILPWVPSFQTTSMRTPRTIYYVVVGVCCFAFTVHASFTMGFAKFFSVIGPLNIIGECGLYLLGAFIYCARIPEVFFPGKVDILFHGHQIWHIFILIASFFHYLGAIRIMTYALGQ